MSLRDRPRKEEAHYVTCELNPQDCGVCRWIGGGADVSRPSEETWMEFKAMAKIAATVLHDLADKLEKMIE